MMTSLIVCCCCCCCQGGKRVGKYEQKCQQLDVEVTALKQQLLQEEHINKSKGESNPALP